MFAKRLVMAGAVPAVVLGVAWLIPGEPARAQSTRSAACAEGDRTMPQLQRELDEAREAQRIYWAQRNPGELARYRQDLRAAIAQRRVTPDLERIATDLSFYLMPEAPDFIKTAVQPEMLQLADRIARTAPASSQPLPEDRALAGRLRLAVARANQRWQRAMTSYVDSGCLQLGPTSSDASGSGAFVQPGEARFIRVSSLAMAQSLSTEASTGLVCAETQQVLTALENEEKQAVEVMRMRWALDNSDNLQVYVAQLRAAQQAGSLAPNLERIAAGLVSPIRPGASAEVKLLAQAYLLQELERVDRDFQAILDETAPTPDYLYDDTPRDELELSLERTRYQVELRRTRMTQLNCNTVELPPVEPFQRRADPVAAGLPAPGPNTAQVCAETRAVLVQLERDEHAAYLLRWAMDDNYHDSFYAITELRDAARKGEVTADFNEIATMFGMDPTNMSQAQKLAAQPGLRAQVTALADRVRAMTGRPSDTFNNPDAYDPASALFDDPDEPAPPVAPAVRARERQIEDAWSQASYQAELRRQRIKDLSCDSLPTESNMSTTGTLQRVTTKLKENNGPPDARYTYGDNWAELLIVGDPPDRRRIRWTFNGVPGSLSPRDQFTITVTGELDFKPDGAEQRGANNSAGVYYEGLTAIRADNGYFYLGARREGTYTFQVPDNARKVVIALAADNNQGTFIRHCYGDCGPTPAP